MTPSSDTLGRELDELERLQRALGEISKRHDAERAHDLVDLRRKLAAQLAVVTAEATAVFGAQDPALEREFRQRFGAMRSAAAHLQASWPAVKARDDTSGDYARAVAEVRRIDADTLAWVRERLSRTGSRKT